MVEMLKRLRSLWTTPYPSTARLLSALQRQSTVVKQWRNQRRAHRTLGVIRVRSRTTWLLTDSSTPANGRVGQPAGHLSALAAYPLPVRDAGNALSSQWPEAFTVSRTYSKFTIDIVHQFPVQRSLLRFYGLGCAYYLNFNLYDTNYFALS